MDLATINEDPDLRDTPLGRMTLQQPNPGGAVFVVVERQHDGENAIIGVVDPSTRRGVFDAVYGKRQWEALHIYERAESQRIAKEKADERQRLDARADFRRAMDRHMARSVDGRDTLIGALVNRRRR